MHTDETTVHANRIDIAYDTYGDRSSPPMVLIMGLLSQMIFWEDEFCARLADKKFWVIRHDNRDAGNSSKLDMMGMPSFQDLLNMSTISMPYTLQDMAKDTISLLDALDIPHAHIVGASMGGMIAQILAMEYPERVRTLTVIMFSTGDPLLPPPKPEVFPYLSIPFPMQADLFIEHFTMMWKILNGKELPVDEEHIRELASKTFDRGVSPIASSRQLAAVIASGSRKEQLQSIKTPTLVIHGEIDPLLPVQCGIDVAESIPGSTLKIIPSMGHTLHPYLWEEIIDAIEGHAKNYVTN